MKVLLIADRFDRSALCEASWWGAEIAAHAVGRGWQVEAVCRDSHAEAPAGVTVWSHGAAGFESALADALAAPPDRVLLTSSGPFSIRATEALAHSPLIVDVLTHWPLCPNDDLMQRPSCRRCELRYPADACGSCAGLERLRDMETRLRLPARASAVIAHARFQSERLSGLLQRPVDLVGLGVDPETFRPDPAPPQGEAAQKLWNSRGNGRRVLLLGPPTGARGAGVLVDVMVGVRARVTDAQFVVAGEDPENFGWSAAFLSQLQHLGLQHGVTVLGRIAPADWPAVIAACDVGIAPGLWDDPCGLFVLHAFASGMPVVAGGRGAHVELLQHGSGMLASPESPAMFADRVAMLLTHEGARRVMGEAARLHAVEHHDIGIALEALDRVLERPLDGMRHAA